MEEKEKCLSEVESLEKQMAIRFAYIDRIAEAEAKRLDAIRVVDAEAVALAREKAETQATVLANQVIASSEALRNLISSTNNSVVQQIAQISTQLNERLSLLEKIQYENEGRKGVSIPLMMIAGLTGGAVVFIVEKLLSL